MLPQKKIQELIVQDITKNNTVDVGRLKTDLDSHYAHLIKIFTSILDAFIPQLPPQTVKERVDAICSILSKPVVDLPILSSENINEFRGRLKSLVELHYSLQPKTISKIAKTGIFINSREQIKSILNTVNIDMRKSIDPHINAYLEAQRDLLATYVASYNAFEQADRINKIKSKYHNAQFEILILKRHEVCSDFHKGLGFNPDTGLDALHFNFNQSDFELTTSKSVQTRQLQMMKNLGLIGRVEMLISPVKRAYETALFATFSSELVDSVSVDNYFAEKQLNSELIASGRAYQFASEVAKKFIKEGYKNVIAKEDFIINGETEFSFFKRLNEAYRRTLSCPEKKNEVSMKVIVGHGAMNNELIEQLKNNITNNNIPNTTRKLEFGGQYNLIIVRDENQHIIALDDGGKSNRYGMIDEDSLEVVPINIEEYIAYLDEKIKVKKSGERKAILLFQRCMVEPNVDKLESIINNEQNLALMLDMLSLFQFETYNDFKDTWRIHCILSLLLEAQFNQLEKRVQNTYLFSWFKSGVTNYTSGKYPDVQLEILEQLRKIDYSQKPESILENLDNISKESLEKCKEGKVTNLCRAICHLAYWRYNLNQLENFHLNLKFF